MPDETMKPKLEIVEELDEEEREFRALRRDLPGVKGAAEAGLLAISVGKAPTPKNEFYRTHPDFRPVFPLVNVEAGMDRHYIAVMPNMVAPLAAIGITVADHVALSDHLAARRFAHHSRGGTERRGRTE